MKYKYVDKIALFVGVIGFCMIRIGCNVPPKGMDPRKAPLGRLDYSIAGIGTALLAVSVIAIIIVAKANYNNPLKDRYKY